MTKREKDQEDYSSMINANSMLLTFEGWIKYIEGFTRCLQATDKVNSTIILDCIGEILEYMNTLRGQLYNLLIHCENVLEKEEHFEIEKQQLEAKIKILEQVINQPQLEELEEEDGKEV